MLESKIVTVKNQRCGPEPQGQKTPCKRTEGASVALTRHAAGRHVEQHHLDKQKIENVKNCHILRPQRFLDYKGSWTPKILGPQSSPDPKGLHHKGFQKTRQMAQSAWRSKPRTPSTRACSPARRTRITSERTPLTCLQHLGTPNLLVYALLDAARLDAASSPSTDACTTCALPSLPCWSAMLAPTCGSYSVQSGPARSRSLAASTSHLESTPQGTKVPRPTKGHSSGGKTSHHPLRSSSNRRPLGQKRKCDGDSQPLKCQRLSPFPSSWTGGGVRNLLSCAPGNGKRSKRAQKTTEKR
ncbi:uncharacterized protein LOC133406784 isoform X2 [Phycodurus eques]|uniref:uncharacterized protein LOC133406784 isoform X2 n=1 Tax=Phycodurus eques TaxID=693459 RepID=UPI002ACE69AC|nr:uncharacterized protein LOC133406784 isoform X2 [Phycodurus eques]